MSETRTTAAAAEAAPRSTEAVEAVAAATGEHPEEPGSPSLAKGLFLGELPQDLATPYPRMDVDERRRVGELIRSLYTITDDLYDPKHIEEQRWIGDEVIAALGEAGLLGLPASPTSASSRR